MVRLQAPPRISWSPEQRRLLVCAGGKLQMVDLDGAVICEIERRPITLGNAPSPGDRPGSTVLAGYLDARWLRDGRISAVDVFGLPLILSMQGNIQSDYGQPPSPRRAEYASIAEDGATYVVVLDGQLVVRGIGHYGRGGQWMFSSRNYPSIAPIEVSRATATLSRDGNQIAIGFETDAMLGTNEPPPRPPRPAGRGWVVLDSAPRVRSYATSEPSPIDDYWFPTEPVDVPMALSFDGSGRRLGIASGCARGSGTIRVGAMSRAPDSVGAATAVAFDELGVRVAYVIPQADRRLRVDYLSTTRPGPRAVEISDTHAIDPGIAPVAIAFDPEGHRIACLDGDGAIEIVPVP